MWLQGKFPTLSQPDSSLLPGPVKMGTDRLPGEVVRRLKQERKSISIAQAHKRSSKNRRFPTPRSCSSHSSGRLEFAQEGLRQWGL